MRLTNIQLIHAAYHAARYLPKASAELVRELATRLDVALVAQRETAKQRDALAAENAYLLNGAARELSTSWMLHKTMLGTQAALACVSQGDIQAAREWLEGTTDEAQTDMPEEISVSELQAWFDSQMVSNDGNSGFLTRAEAEEAIKKACPATEAYLAEVRASTLEDLAKKKRDEKMSLHPDTFALGSVTAALDMQANELDDLATQLRQEAAQ